MKWQSKHMTAHSQVSDEVWCLKRGVAAMQGPWGGKSQSKIINKFISAMLYRLTTNQMYPSLSFRFTSEYLHYRQVAKWADMFLQYAEWRREISKVVNGALDPYKWVRSCSLAYSNSFLVSIRKRNLQKCCICHIVEHICAKNKTSLWANPWKENQVRDNIAEHWYELKYCTLRQK